MSVKLNHKIAIIEGDGIGVEVIHELRKLILLLQKEHITNFEVEFLPYSADFYLKTGQTITSEKLLQLKEDYNAIFLGALGDPRIADNKHADDILLGMRFVLDLFVNYRPIKLYNIDYCPLKNIEKEDQIDIAIFRENTQDCYRGIGGILDKDTKKEVVIENSVHTYLGVERILRCAFEYADKNNITSVVMSDKSNAMKNSGHLWQKLFKEIGIEYPKIEKKHFYIDALCMEIIRDPAQFKVIVTSNMFGDIISDLASQLHGGIGLSASCNYNPEHTNFYGLFEPVHGSAPNIAGKNIANPFGAILSFVLFLRRIDENDIAEKIEKTIKKLLLKKEVTIDLGGNLKTTEVGDLLCKYLKDSIHGNDIS
jgi:3-isopropylmalate dehydrogenase